MDEYGLNARGMPKKRICLLTLPLKDRQQIQRLFGQPAQCQLHQALMKADVGKLLLDTLNIGTRQCSDHENNR